jgi:hypothetical protein
VIFEDGRIISASKFGFETYLKIRLQVYDSSGIRTRDYLQAWSEFLTTGNIRLLSPGMWHRIVRYVFPRLGGNCYLHISLFYPKDRSSSSSGKISFYQTTRCHILESVLLTLSLWSYMFLSSLIYFYVSDDALFPECFIVFILGTYIYLLCRNKSAANMINWFEANTVAMNYSSVYCQKVRYIN